MGSRVAGFEVGSENERTSDLRGAQGPMPLNAEGEGEPESLDSVESRVFEALDRGDDRRALALLMDAYGTSIYRFCRQMVADEALADDAHQVTFIQAFEGLSGFSRRSSARTWLFSIARHRCLDALKSRNRRRSRFLPLLDFLKPGAEPEVDDPHEEDRLIRISRRRELADCLDRLQVKAKTALLLRFHEELSFHEMAEVCGERAPTLQARVARSLPVLRRCLERRDQAA